MLTNNKKIALCISGQPRGIPRSCNELIDNIVKVNENVDIFLHAWFNPNNIGKNYGSAQPAQDSKVGYIKEGTDKILLEQLNPKKYIIEPQKAFPFAKKLKSAPTARQEIMASIFYSMYKSNELKKKYEEENSFKYDCVIRTRYDLHYHHPICVADYEDFYKEKIVVSARYQHDQDRTPWRNLLPMVDIFAFSSSENMDIFCSVFPNMISLNKLITPPYGEIYLGYHTRVLNKVDLYCAPFNFDILHRVVDMGTL